LERTPNRYKHRGSGCIGRAPGWEFGSRWVRSNLDGCQYIDVIATEGLTTAILDD
jgi:hypothetical protein